MSRLADFKLDWSAKVDSIGLKPWQKAYGDGILERCTDLQTVGQSELVESLLKRLEKWLQGLHPSVAEGESSEPVVDESTPEFSLWTPKDLLSQLSSVEQKVKYNQSLIPRAESQRFLQKTVELREVILEAEEDQHFFMEEWAESIKQLRLLVIDRLFRSLQAMGSLVFSGATSVPGTSVAPSPNFASDGAYGPYNSIRIFQETMDYIGAGDPIWVGDFLELMRSGSKMAERFQVK